MIMIRRIRALLFGVVIGTILLGAQAPRAQEGSGTDLSSLLQSLSPEQQEAVMSRLGAGGGTGGLGAGGGLGQEQGGLLRPGQASEREQALRQLPEGEEKEPLIPVLKGDDWVIIEIGFQLAPRIVSPTNQALQSLLAQPGATGGLGTAQALQAVQALQASSGGNAPAVTPPPGAGLGAAGLLGAAGQQPGQQSSVPPGAPSGPAAAAAPSYLQNNTAGQMSEEDLKRLQELMELIRSKNPYRLSHDGALTLPGFAPMPLLGLTEDQATLRLKIEPAFRYVDIRLTRLPLKKTGAEGLKPFGYDLFNHAPSTFAPVTNVPVPADYVVGSGDELEVQLYGSQNRTLRLKVGRDGRINFPQLGPVSVAGQLFSKVRSELEARVERQMIGVRAGVSMADTRAIRVFVLGEARRPGSYTISGLGTITSALYAAGGVKQVGSLRRIELKREGQVVRRLDLYDLLIRGDTTDDAKLLQGDVIFIPPVGSTIGVDGEVRRPAIYEVLNESTVADVVQLAGGLTPEADKSVVMLTRVEDNGRRVVLQVDVGAVGGQSPVLHNGDQLRVARLRPTLDAAVTLQGHLFTPGAVAFRQGMHLSDALHSVDELKPGADIHYVLVRRELPPDRRIEVLSADLSRALQARGSSADIELQPRDQITVFDLSSGRDRIIRPLLDELRMQSSAQQPSDVVQVEGHVKVPGEYPLEPGMTVSDLIRAGGGAADAAALGGTAELTRYKVVNGQARRTELMSIDLGAALKGDPAANVRLEPFDDLNVKEISEWETQESVTLKGEFRYPGRYVIRDGETLRSVIARAGGLTQYAFPEGSVFTREGLKKREQEQMDALATRMQTDLASLAVRGAAAGVGGGANALAVGQGLLTQLRASKAVGRLVIDLPRLMRDRAGSGDDIVLRDGDLLIVPKFQQQVTVIGEVQSATSHLYRPGLLRDDYIALSGGTTRSADRSKIYVVRANGGVIASGGNRWFHHGSNVTIKPGDTVVVPLDTERMPALPFWQAVTSILYNVALGAAAIRVLH